MDKNYLHNGNLMMLSIISPTVNTIINSSLYFHGNHDDNRVNNNIDSSNMINNNVYNSVDWTSGSSSAFSMMTTTLNSNNHQPINHLNIGISHENENGTSTTLTELNQLNVLEVTSYLCLFFLGAPANLIVFYNIFKNSAYKRTRNEFLLSNLVIADSIVTCLMIPSEIMWRFSITWIYGVFACKVFQFYRALGIYSSSSILVCISIDRFIAVIYPFKYTSCAQLVHKCVTCAWIISITASLPQMVLFSVQAHPEISDYTQCVDFDAFTQEWHRKLYNIFSLCVVYVIPLLIIIICYTGICIKLFANSRCLGNVKAAFDDCWNSLSSVEPSTSLSSSSLHQNHTTNHHYHRSSPSTATTTTTYTRETESLEILPAPESSVTAKRQKIQSRVLKEAFIIILAFIICWSPYVIAVIWYQIDRNSASQINQDLQAILFMFAVSNSCVNPYIYGKSFVFRNF
ncbi:adipokinetic hormone/corazonin-related peptide receptor variant I-like [Panonychus citri]|uniref:adipokinetic hormone/corazonin-related peptide receptor variant I-like n=1 Tax=Panonychus citri TaxID=50023 RepID=UPI0023070A22|nr:adipokinetic hormone/corazonin-related peptide receptor variant I-like [Panonychus citri]